MAITTSTPQMTADWNAYFAGSQPGQSRQWGGGTLTRNADGTANFAYNGQNNVLRRDMPFQQIAALSPQIADEWYKNYGYTAPSNVTNQTVAKGIIPKMNAMVRFDSQVGADDPNSPFGMAGSPGYAPPLKASQFIQNGAYDPSTRTATSGIRPPSPSVAAPTSRPPQSNNNAAMVEALRQKPARFEGFGMGLGTNAQLPKVQTNVPVQKLVPGQMPNGLFSTR